MKHHFLLAAICALTILIVSSSAHAGAWCMRSGSLYTKLSYNRYFTVYTFDEGGHSTRNPHGSSFKDVNITLYAEYGLFDNLTLIASAPYKELTSRYRYMTDDGLKRKTSRYHGLGDIELGVKYCLLKKPAVVSLQTLVKCAWFYDSDEDVLPGNNQNDYEIKLLAGKSLWPFPGYCGLELGYRWRAGDPSDEFRYLLEFGMNVTEKLSFRVKLDGIKSMKNARLPEDTAPASGAYIDYRTGQVITNDTAPESASKTFTNPSLGLEYDLGKLEFTLAYQCSQRWSVECTYTNYPYGENIADGDQYSFALVYYFSPPVSKD